MAILASAIITSVRRFLLDPSPGDTWLDADLLAMLNRAERVVVNVKRDAYPVRANLTLVAGSVQTLPATGLSLMQVYKNVVSGRRINQVVAELQDVAARYWPAATQEVDVQHWTSDERNPTQFEVVPPNNGTGQIDILYGAVPTPIASTASNINLKDHHEQVLIDIVLSFAYGESSTRGDVTKQAFHWQRWGQALGLTDASQKMVVAKTGEKGDL